MTEGKADIALIGLAVMGQNLILNMADHGYTVVAFNRTVSKVDEFLADAAAGHENVIGAHSLEEAVGLLKRPRKVMLMVKAGEPVDDFIELLLPHLEPGDLIIDGGNSHFPDTIRRTQVPGGEGPAVHRHRRLRRRGGCAARAVDHARRQPEGVAAREGDLPVDRGEDPRRGALLRLGRRGRRRPLREDDPQRDRVRRHAADLRGLPAAPRGRRAERRRAARRCSPSGTRASWTAT